MGKCLFTWWRECYLVHIILSSWSLNLTKRSWYITLQDLQTLPTGRAFSRPNSAGSISYSKSAADGWNKSLQKKLEPAIKWLVFHFLASLNSYNIDCTRNWTRLARKVSIVRDLEKKILTFAKPPLASNNSQISLWPYLCASASGCMKCNFCEHFRQNKLDIFQYNNLNWKTTEIPLQINHVDVSHI